MIGVLQVQLAVYESRSLKDKRRVIKSLKDRLRDRHKVSVAETDHQNTWQQAELSAAIVSSDRRQAQALLDRVDAFVASDAGVRIVDSAVIFY